MNLVEELAGELCKVLFPIEDRIYVENPDSGVAVCTLSSMSLLNELANSSLMSKINMAGRLLSENKGIETMVRNIVSNGKIRIIILCGNDAVGHKAGHSLICLHRNGIDLDGRIIGSSSPHPILSLTDSEVKRFQNQVKIINRIGETDISNLQSEIVNEI